MDREMARRPVVEGGGVQQVLEGGLEGVLEDELKGVLEGVVVQLKLRLFIELQGWY